MGQPNLNQMMQQVQKMQADMAKAQEELKHEVVEASAGGGMVTVKISGELELKELTIDPDAVDPEDVEMLQDMVQAAVNEAIRSAQELAASKMNAAAGGLAGPAAGLGGLRASPASRSRPRSAGCGTVAAPRARSAAPAPLGRPGRPPRARRAPVRACSRALSRRRGATRRGARGAGRTGTRRSP